MKDCCIAYKKYAGLNNVETMFYKSFRPEYFLFWYSTEPQFLGL